MTIRHLSDLFALETPKSDVLKIVRNGLPVLFFNEILDDLDVNQKDLIEVVGIKQPTLSRRRDKGTFNKEESDRIYRLAKVFRTVLNFFDGDKEKARKWFLAPRGALGGQSPFESCDSDLGSQEVIQLIGRLEHGVGS